MSWSSKNYSNNQTRLPGIIYLNTQDAYTGFILHPTPFNLRQQNNSDRTVVEQTKYRQDSSRIDKIQTGQQQNRQNTNRTVVEQTKYGQDSSRIDKIQTGQQQNRYDTNRKVAKYT